MTEETQPALADELDLGQAVTAQIEGGVEGALATRAMTEIQSAIIVAKKFPRDEMAAFQRLMGACERATFAEKARYKFPRGSKQVTGASIHLAHAAAQAWGNIRSGFTIIPTEDNEEWIQLEAWAHDAETNTWKYASDRFPNKIQRKVWEDGRPTTVELKPETERDRRELVNRRASLAVRNCLLQLLPFDLIEDAEEKCEETATAHARRDLQKSRKDTVKKLLLAYDKDFAVTQAMLEDKLGHPVADIDARELTDLREWFMSMKDGNTTREDHFTVAPAESTRAEELQEEVDAAEEPGEELPLGE